MIFKDNKLKRNMQNLKEIALQADQDLHQEKAH
jgi:hypothetical protein